MKTQFLFLFTMLYLHAPSLFSQNEKVLKINPDTSHVLHWGQIQIPLGYYKTDHPKGTLIEFNIIPRKKISIKDFIASLRERMFVYKNQQIYGDVEAISLFINAPRSSKQIDKFININLGKGQPKQLGEKDIQKILKLVEHQTNLSFIVNKGLMMGWGIIDDPFSPVEAPIQVQKDSLDLFDFQLLEPLKGATILRIDTLQNQRIFNIYKNDGKTEIIHIPNFRTGSRTIDEKNETNWDKVFSNLSSYPNEEMLFIPEYVNYHPSELTLMMGKLMANPDGKNIPLSKFKTEKGKLKLYHNDEKLTIKNCRLSIYNKEEKVFNYILENPQRGKWQSYLSKVDYKDSIYIDKLIVEKGKETYYLGQSFLFQIGKEHLKE